MIWRKGDDDWAPSPEQLAAYADGELEDGPLVPLRQRVERWLADHPEAAAEVEELRRLDRLWQEHAPAEPGEADWAPVLAALEQAPLRPPRWPNRGGRRPYYLAAAVLAATAAALLLALSLPRPLPPDVGPPPEEVEPFPVATAEEVEITSIDGADTRALVVGVPPVTEPLLLAAAGEVTLTTVAADLQMMGGNEGSPMIWAALQADPAEGPE
jgi:hypothetical protein